MIQLGYFTIDAPDRRFDLRVALPGFRGEVRGIEASATDVGDIRLVISGVATGVRGISDEELRSAKGNLPDNVQSLEGFAASPGQARAFAEQGGLRSKALPYAAR